mgnify:CR=1 FL=1
MDVGSASVRLDDGGGYTLTIGSADMGTGCDTILSQMAAEDLECSVEEISVYAADTDVSPYDSGSYASSTTYVTGRAVQLACEKLRRSMCRAAALFLDTKEEQIQFDGSQFVDLSTGNRYRERAGGQRMSGSRRR